jgi:IS1 family transposase
MVKHPLKRKLVKVEQRTMCADRDSYRGRLNAVGLSGKIISSYIERLNLSTRHGISKLVRRMCGLTQNLLELVEYIEWWQAYYP